MYGLLPPAPLPAPTEQNRWAESTTTRSLPPDLVTTPHQLVWWTNHRVRKKIQGRLDKLVDVAFSLAADDRRPLFLHGVGQNCRSRSLRAHYD